MPVSHAVTNVGSCSISFRVCSMTGGAKIQTTRAKLLTLGAGRKHAHLLLERQQLHVDAAGGGALLELLEVLGKPVTRELFLDLDRRLELSLAVLDALFHPSERLERRLLRQRRHRLVDALLRLSTALTRDEQILLALGLFDLVVQIAQRILELLGLG